jgi:hypothetical protein
MFNNKNKKNMAELKGKILAGKILVKPRKQKKKHKVE